MEKIQIRRSEHRKGNRRVSAVKLQIHVKKDMWLVARDEIHMQLLPDALNASKLGLTGTIDLIFDQTVNLKQGDILEINYEISSARADIRLKKQIEE